MSVSYCSVLLSICGTSGSYPHCFCLYFSSYLVKLILYIRLRFTQQKICLVFVFCVQTHLGVISISFRDNINHCGNGETHCWQKIFWFYTFWSRKFVACSFSSRLFLLNAQFGSQMPTDAWVLACLAARRSRDKESVQWKMFERNRMSRQQRTAERRQWGEGRVADWTETKLLERPNCFCFVNFFRSRSSATCLHLLLLPSQSHPENPH